MAEQAELRPPRDRVLPEDAQRGLREAFAREVAARLPRLRQAQDTEAVRRDAHSLASSAWVVGQREISVLARGVEEQLQDGAGTDPAALPALVAALVAALESAGESAFEAVPSS